MRTWDYRSRSEPIRHIGPTAQDLKTAFRLGASDTVITSADVDGVALAAIQGLNQKLDIETAARRAENAEFKEQLAELRQLYRTICQRPKHKLAGAFRAVQARQFCRLVLQWARSQKHREFRNRFVIMKNILILVGIFVCAFLVDPPHSSAQGTAFTYQGRLDNNGAPANGSYDFRFRLAVDPFGNDFVGGNVLTNGVGVSAGLFTVALDFGGAFSGSNYWLEIAVRTNGGGGYTTLAPLQPLPPTPYAIFAAGASNVLGVVPGSGLSGSYNSSVNFNNAANNFAGTFHGNGGGISNVNAAALGGLGASNFWQLAGNVVAPGAFLGSLNNQPVELRANNQRALRLESAGASVNVIGGWSNNLAAPGVTQATIGGGGGASVLNPNAFYTNRVLDSYGTIAGGLGNVVGNTNLDFADARGATVGGGSENTAASAFSTAAGGTRNFVNATYSAIGGGYFNTIENTNEFGAATIGGGLQNYNIGWAATIAGGWQNRVTGVSDFIGGGTGNSVSNHYGSISGGAYNSIHGFASTIGGGQYNTASNSYSTVGGGGNNAALALSSVIAGGFQNQVLETDAAIVGGYLNTAAGYRSFIGGGTANSSSNQYVVIGGGNANTASGDTAFIGGGVLNKASGPFAVIAGGADNTADGFLATIGGGQGHRAIANNSTIVGGLFNTNNGVLSYIGAGAANLIGNAYAMIGGGDRNLAYGYASVVGGGATNTANGEYATVPGGNANVAAGQYSFAAGRQAKAFNSGSFVWADSQAADFSSSGNNQFLIRAAGGVGIGLNNPAAALDVNGTARMSGFQLPAGAAVNRVLASDASGNGSWQTVSNALLASDGASLNKVSGGTMFAVPATPFVGIGRSTQITPAEYFGISTPGGSGAFGGMYINTTNAGGLPFYGYASAGAARAYHYMDGADGNKWKLAVGGGLRLTVTPAGNVGIGLAGPTFQLQLSADSAAKPNGGSWANSSDARVKQNIQPMKNALERLSRLRGVTFEWVNPEDHANQIGLQAGFIAQEVEAVFPNWVRETEGGQRDRALTPDGKIKSLSLPFEFDALVVEALRELRVEKDAQIAELQKANAVTRQELAEAKKRADEMQTRLAALERAVARLAAAPPELAGNRN